MNKDNWQQFLKLCGHLKTNKEFDSFFTFFLTIEEKQALADRVSLVDELLKGDKTQREIAAELQISITKITRGSNGVKLMDNKLKNFLLKHYV